MRTCSLGRCARLGLEVLEARDVASVWTPLTSPIPDAAGAQAMLLLTDGTVMIQGGSDRASRQWYRLTPDAAGGYSDGTFSPLAPMGLERLYFASNVLPSGTVLVLGGEYTGPDNSDTLTNSGETYNPLTDSWSAVASFPQSQFGDTPTEVLADGTVLAGYRNGPQTYRYDPSTDTWATAGTKLRSDRSEEETWTLLPGDGVLSYDIFSSLSSGTGHAQRYVGSTDTWVDAGTVPVPLSGGRSGDELGPAFLLPDGRVFQIGGNGNTALYTPGADTWAAGPTLPNGAAADDAPGAGLPNGHVIFAADTPPYQGPTQLLDFDPVTGTLSPVPLPAALSAALNQGAFLERMLVLPSGDVLLSDSTRQLWEFTPDGGPSDAWRPSIGSVAPNGDGSFTLTGTQLNGLSEGAGYGDDAEMSSNYPIVRLSAANGTVSFARTYDWVDQVSTGGTPVSTRFAIPDGLANGTYTLNVIANGIASAPVPFVVDRISTTTALTATPNPAQAGAVVTLTATVSPAPDGPGTVTFRDNGANLPGGAGVAVDNGVATFQTSALGGGSHTLTALYSGAAGFAGSQGTTQIVIDATPAVTSGASATFVQYQSGPAFTVTTTGTPAPALSLTGTLPSGVTFTDNGDGTGTFTGTPGAGTGGAYPLTLTATNSGGAAQQNFTLNVTATYLQPYDIAAGPAAPILFDPTDPDRFVVEFNAPIATAPVNLYTSATTPTGALTGDLTLVNTTTDTVVFAPSTTATTYTGWSAVFLSGPGGVNSAAEFIRTGPTSDTQSPRLGFLDPGTYQLTLHSAPTSWSGAGTGTLATLDGAGNRGNSDFVGTFTVPTIGATALTVTVPSFARGPNEGTGAGSNGTTIAVPAGGNGVPVLLDTGVGVGAVTATINWNPTDLDVIGFTPNPALTGANVSVSSANLTAASVTVTADAQSAPSAQITATAGTVVLGWLLANVPASAALTSKDLITITATADTSTGVNLPVNTPDALHVVGYLGDVNARGVLNSASVTSLQRFQIGSVAGQVFSGFDAFKDVDPILLADFDLNRLSNPADVTTLQRKVLNAASVTAIPTIPSTHASAVTLPGADPVLYLGASYTVGQSGPFDLGTVLPGQELDVPVRVLVTDPDGVSVSAAQVALDFNPDVFAFEGVSAGAIADGTLGGTAFAIRATEPAPGRLHITGWSAHGPNLASGTDQTLFIVHLRVKPTAPTGTTQLNLLPGDGAFLTRLSGNGQPIPLPLTLDPAPTAADTDTVDATALIATGPGRVSAEAAPWPCHPHAPTMRMALAHLWGAERIPPPHPTEVRTRPEPTHGRSDRDFRLARRAEKPRSEAEVVP
jgi:hypothetical protein